MATFVDAIRTKLGVANSTQGPEYLPPDRISFEAKFVSDQNLKLCLEKHGHTGDGYLKSLAVFLYDNNSQGIWPRLATSGEGFLDNIAKLQPLVSTNQVPNLVQQIQEQKTALSLKAVSIGRPAADTNTAHLGQTLQNLSRSLESLKKAVCILANDHETGLSKTSARLDPAADQTIFKRSANIISIIERKHRELCLNIPRLVSHFVRVLDENRELLKRFEPTFVNSFDHFRMYIHYEGLGVQVPQFTSQCVLDLFETRFAGWALNCPPVDAKLLLQLNHAVNACSPAEIRIPGDPITYPTKTSYMSLSDTERKHAIAKDSETPILEAIHNFLNIIYRMFLPAGVPIESDLIRDWRCTIEQLQVAKAIALGLAEDKNLKVELKAIQILHEPLQKSRKVMAEASWAFRELKSMYLDNLLPAIMDLSEATTEAFCNLVSHEDDLLSSDLERIVRSHEKFSSACQRIRTTNAIPEYIDRT